MYELAFALAELGHDVELRGCISRAAFDELREATGRHPRIDAPARRPEAGEVVLLLEGFADPLAFGAVALSAARPVLLLLAPAGLMGWSFEPGWSLPDPQTVDLDSVNRPASYRAMAALGFELWTHSDGIVAAAAAAGVACRWVGNGTPGPVPEPVPARHDVVVVGGNRWEPLARQVVDGLDADVVVTRAGGNAELLAQLGSARLLVHPMRTEGTSRLAVEARLVGTVPVVLDHPFGAGFSEADGVVVVPDLEAMRPAVAALLADPARIDALAAAGRRFAERWRDWPSYLERVDAAIRSPVTGDGAGARAEIGSAIDALVAGARDEQLELRRAFTEIEAHARALEVDRDALQRVIDDDLLPQIRSHRPTA
jgi:hypothetical protein